jgi:hypothetical protein
LQILFLYDTETVGFRRIGDPNLHIWYLTVYFLQLKSISDTFHIVTKTQASSNIFTDTTTYVCIALALFASYYGTRYVDASEKKRYRYCCSYGINLESLLF